MVMGPCKSECGMVGHVLWLLHPHHGMMMKVLLLLLLRMLMHGRRCVAHHDGTRTGGAWS